MRAQSKAAATSAARPRIGIDLMGSDAQPEDLLAAILHFIESSKEKVEITLLATAPVFKKFRKKPLNVRFVIAKEVITMEDEPLRAIRRKPNSSMHQGIDLLKRKEIDAFISAGNTGALMACAKLNIPMLPNILRPALLAVLPTRHKEIAVLDIGANTVFKDEHLLQFAQMGIAFQKARGCASPRVGLLNIGVEAKKGTPALVSTYKKLLKLNTSKKNAPFIGNIEGRDVFQSDIDVLVTDGFTGNVFLKTAEGVAAVILEELEQNSKEKSSAHLLGVLSAMRKRLHYAEYPGAILCGIDGVIVKCHGEATPSAFFNSILSAARLVRHNFINKIKLQLSELC